MLNGSISGVDTAVRVDPYPLHPTPWLGGPATYSPSSIILIMSSIDGDVISIGQFG